MTRIACVFFLLAQAPAGPLWRNPTSVSPVEFGARCDGVTDDTLAFQAAINQADSVPYRDVVVPAGVCRVSNTLIVGNVPGRYSSVGLHGAGEYRTVLAYSGSGNAIEARHMAAFRWSGFEVRNTGPRGATIGILQDGCTPACGTGTQSTLGTFEHVFVRGFHIGILAGQTTAVSEMTYQQLTLEDNDIGWSDSGYNSLNFTFVGLYLGNNGRGVSLGGPNDAGAGGPWVGSGITVVGGSSYGQTVADFYHGAPFDRLSITGFRAERRAGVPFMTYEPNPAWFAPTSLNDTMIVGGDPNDVVIAGNNANLAIRNSSLGGKIAVWSNGSIVLEHVFAMTTGTPGYPVLWPNAIFSYQLHMVGCPGFANRSGVARNNGQGLIWEPGV